MVEYGWNTQYKMMHVIVIIAAIFSSNQLHADDSFTNTGFNNWKKALDKTACLIKYASC